jgi:hypothetical protein
MRLEGGETTDGEGEIGKKADSFGRYCISQ